MKIFPFQATYPNFEMIASPDLFFSTVKYDYPEYLKNGFFKHTDTSSVYIYKIETPIRSHLGILGCLDINEYLDGNIIKHEKTLASKEQTMLKLLLQRQAMVKPVLLGYPDHVDISEQIKSIIKSKKPFFSVHFEEENQMHHFYQVVIDEVGEKLLNTFSKHVKKVYIADGHHRCSTSARLFQTMGSKGGQENKYQKLLCSFFPFSELDIHDYNWIIEIVGNLSNTRLMAGLSKLFYIKYLKKAKKPSRKHELTMYINLEWYRLRWKQEVLDKYMDQEVILDAEILNQEVVQAIMGIKDVEVNANITYVEGISGTQGVIEKTIRGQNRIGFCVYPVQIEELVAIADHGKTLPPKSTWFEPRVKNGLIVKEFQV